MAITCYNIAADFNVNRSGNKQEEKIEPPMGVLFFILFQFFTATPGLLIP